MKRTVVIDDQRSSEATAGAQAPVDDVTSGGDSKLDPAPTESVSDPDSAPRRWTIRLRTTVIATVIFVVFGVAMSLVARSVVVHILTSQRAGVAESTLDRVLVGFYDPGAIEAIAADAFAQVSYYDVDGKPMTVDEVMSVVSALNRSVEVEASSVIVGGGDDGSTQAGDGDAPPDGSIQEFSSGAPGLLDGSGAGNGTTVMVTQGADDITARAEVVLGDTPITITVTASTYGDALAVFDRTMVALVAALALVVAAMSWFSVSFALRPVEAIRRQVARTDPSDLSHHVPRPGTGDEIDRLATTMNELLDRLHRAAIEQKRFVSDASHELRSPVTAALATIQTVDPSQMGPGWSEVEPALTDAAVRLSTLIDDLFLMSTLDEQRTSSDVGSINTETDLDEVALQISERPHRRPVWVRVERPVRVRADRRLIDRCVTNLVDNASRHARASVHISVGVTDDGYPELVVTDDGPGIPAEYRETVFERFARLDQSRHADGGGAGLGLPIARQIAEHQGASLVLGDPSDDGGASFHLIFDRPGDGA